MSDIDQTILALVGGDNRSGKRRRDRQDDDSHEDGLEESLRAKYPDWDEMKKWNKHDLMGDQADRQMLRGLSELQRETLLAERKSKLERAEEQMAILRMLESDKHDAPKSRRSSGAEERRAKRERPMTEKERTRESLANLKKQRDRKGAGSHSQMEEPSRSRRSSYSQSEHSDGEIEDRGHKVIIHERKSEKYDRSAGRETSLADLRSIQVLRGDIEKWLHTNFFESTMKGMGKSGDEPVYRVVQIDDIEEWRKVYPLGPTWTKQAMKARHGKSVKTFTFESVSSKPITDAEYKRWVTTMEVENQTFPDAEFIKEKREQLKKAKEHEFTEQELNEMLRRKQKLQKLPGNPAMRITELNQELQKAQHMNQPELVREIQEQIRSIRELAYAADDRPPPPTRNIEQAFASVPRRENRFKSWAELKVKVEPSDVNGKDKGKTPIRPSPASAPPKNSLLTDLSSIPDLQNKLQQFAGKTAKEILDSVVLTFAN
ncbi:RNA polymerase-associated protein rtf1 [Rhizophlyctis rosea]|nr:RNA polymerase-associated protein rtf1 [Rhizophlyctis rosea]